MFYDLHLGLLSRQALPNHMTPSKEVFSSWTQKRRSEIPDKENFNIAFFQLNSEEAKYQERQSRMKRNLCHMIRIVESVLWWQTASKEMGTSLDGCNPRKWILPTIRKLRSLEEPQKNLRLSICFSFNMFSSELRIQPYFPDFWHRNCRQSSKYRDVSLRY